MAYQTAPVPAASVARLPLYLRCLEELEVGTVETVSSSRLAELAGVNAAKLRKDLSHLGSYGTRGVGYQVRHLMHQIQLELGLDEPSPVIVIGLGNLGHALSNHAGFGERGFPIVALFDVDPQKVGQVVGQLRIAHLDELHATVAELGARTAIQRALDAAGGVISEAARQLGMDRANLHRKMRRLDIGRDEDEDQGEDVSE